jgi:AraC-like DNA-binding protein
MPLITVLTRDPAVLDAVSPAPGPGGDIARTRSWERLLWLVRERPVTGVVLDSEALVRGLEADVALTDLRRRFPSLATVFLHRPQLDPMTLFRLGRAGLKGLALVQLDGLVAGLRQAMARVSRHGTEAQVLTTIGPLLPSGARSAVRLALRGVQLGWCTEQLAERAGFSRPHLSVRLKAHGLPSAGHLLIWAKLLHAGRWLADPGRSAESISRQLEYSSGAAFRRALHNYVGGTPTEVKRGGGLALVLRCFLDDCGLSASLRDDRSVA